VLKILFVSMTTESVNNAYNYRLLMLQQGLRQMGLKTDFLYMKDWIRPYMGNRIKKIPPILYAGPFSNLLPRLQDYDVIHTGGAIAAFPFCLYKKRFRAHLVHDVHGDGMSEMMMKWRMERKKIRNTYHLLQAFTLIRVALHRTDYHLVVSNALGKQLREHHIPRERILMLRNGADTQVFKPNGQPTGPFTVCYAGEFQVWQGLDNLIAAARALRELDIRWKFVGFRHTREDREWKERITAVLGKKADLVDRVEHQSLIKHLQSSDMLLSPRPQHPSSVFMFPCKFPEYLAIGRPVLVTEVGDTPHFVRRHRCGLVCPPSAAGLTEAIRRAHDMGREQLLVMGQRARELAEREFSWEALGKKYYRFIAAMGSPKNNQ
jgi:glycosyltransferase involved in cell wall biosynthesis